MIIVETKEEQDIFKLYWDNEVSFIYPVWCDLERHPLNNRISFLYVRFRDQETDDGMVTIDFIIPIEHNDCLNTDMDLSKSTQIKKVYNTKGLLQTNLGISNMVDINSELFFYDYENYPNGLEINELEVLTNFYTRQGFRDNIGKIIPIMRWGNELRKISHSIGYEVSTDQNWVNETMIPTLSDIERLGFRVDRKKFTDRWPDASYQKNLKGDIIYTEYNPYTLTSRPSNRHGGINFGALNKSDGTRECFVPREGNTFVQFDYDAYHIRLIGKLIGYNLPKTSAHQWLADQYGISYEDSKGRTFKNLYGGISEEDKNIKFFNLTDKFIQNHWKESLNRGYFKTLKGRKIQLSWIESPTSQKIFNYLLQSLETELNIDTIGKLKEKGLHRYLVLYQYDSFTFDIPDDIIKGGILKEIKGILEENGFPVHGSYGKTFDKL